MGPRFRLEQGLLSGCCDLIREGFAVNGSCERYTYSGSKEASVAFVEWKVPAFAFSSRDIQVGYIEEATNIIHSMSGEQQPKNRIWVNVAHAVDGAWGIGGVALTNAQLVA